jgi:drug/metabolite transporter (DMT)-like permease
VDRKQVLAFVALSLAWGASFFWIKVALSELGPFTLVALRLLVGGLLLGLTAWLRKVSLPRGWAEWWPLLLLGVINIAVPLVVTSWGQLFIDSGVASILLSTVPLFTVVMAHFLLHDDKLTWMRAAGLLIGFLGVVLLLLRDVGGGSSTFWGYATHMVGAVLYSYAAVMARQYMRKQSLILQAFIPVAFGDLLIWAMLPFTEFPLHLPQQTMPIIAILFLGAVSSFAGYLLYYYLIHSVGPSRMSMVTYTFPLVGVLLGVIALGELLDLSLIMGAALVLGSVFLVNRS